VRLGPDITDEVLKAFFPTGAYFDTLSTVVWVGLVVGVAASFTHPAPSRIERVAGATDAFHEYTKKLGGRLFGEAPAGLGSSRDEFSQADSNDTATVAPTKDLSFQTTPRGNVRVCFPDDSPPVFLSPNRGCDVSRHGGIIPNLEAFVKTFLSLPAFRKERMRLACGFTEPLARI
jgi:hypothetical protein